MPSSLLVDHSENRAINNVFSSKSFTTHRS